MKYIELPLIDYIEPLDEKVTIYIHTKDKRVIVLHDVRSNMSLDSDGVYVDHMLFGKRMTFMMPREDFSHVEYYISPREDSKKYFDELNSFIDEQIEEFNALDTPTEPDEGLFEDLI